MPALATEMKFRIPLKEEKTTLVVVTAYDDKTGEVTVNSEHDGVMTFYAYSFFGGEFSPYPKVGETLKVRLRPIDRKIIEAWNPETTPS